MTGFQGAWETTPPVGPYLGNTVTLDDPNDTWFDQNNLLVALPNTTYANVTANSSGGSQSGYAFVSGFGFNIPTGKTIINIEVAFKCEDLLNNATSVVVGLAISETFYGYGQAIIQEDGGMTYVKISGQPYSFWGTTMTPARVNNSGFGCGIYIVCPTSSSGYYAINDVTITVTYQD